MPHFWYWFILAAVLIILEIFTAGFFIFWFGIAAIFSGIVQLIGAPVWLCWVIFAVIAVIGVLLSKKFANRISGDNNTRIAGEHILDIKGTVIEVLDDAYLVKFKGDTWRCITEDSDIKLNTGDKVRALKIEGAHAVIKKEE